MIAVASSKTIQQAEQYLARHDSVLAGVIAAVGPCPLRPHRRYYQELVRSIVGQQLSIKAAAAIEARFVALFAGPQQAYGTQSDASNNFPSPTQLITADADLLRSAGLSRAKAAYVQDLAQHVLDGRIHFEHLDTLSNSEIVAELTAVKGIGTWTVHMFLMFCMGRLDVLPIGDLGIRNGVQKMYGLDSPVTPQHITDVAAANNWHPYESVASWYVWQSLKL